MPKLKRSGDIFSLGADGAFDGVIALGARRRLSFLRWVRTQTDFDASL